MAGKKGMRQREKVMYDPYNFAAVTEKFRAEQEAEKQAAKQARERAAKLRIKKQALNKVKQNQRKITERTSKEIASGEKRLKKSTKKLEEFGKKKVTGPLGGDVKVKSLSKIGGAPGLDRGIRSKMFIGKKFSEGGSNMDNGDKPKGKRLTKVSPGKVQVYEKPARPQKTSLFFLKKVILLRFQKKLENNIKKVERIERQFLGS